MTRRIVHQLPAESIVPGRHRRVRGEQALPLGLCQGIRKADTGLDPFAHQLQGKKRRMPLVHMEHRRLNPQPAKQSHAAHAKQDFLHDASRVVATVNALREVSKMRLVGR